MRHYIGKKHGILDKYVKEELTHIRRENGGRIPGTVIRNTFTRIFTFSLTGLHEISLIFNFKNLGTYINRFTFIFCILSDIFSKF